MTRSPFEVLILGSASASPTADRNPSGQLLNVSERYFLIDCGEGTQMQLRRFRARFQSIGHILISHLHGDHFFGLPGLLSSMHLLGRTREMHVYAPESLQEVVDTINRVADTHFNFPVIWHVTSASEIQPLFSDDKVEVHSFPLKHRVPCTGFLFREKPLPRKIDKERLGQLNISLADIHRLKAGFDVVNKSGEMVRNIDATVDPPPPRSYAYCSDTAYAPEICDTIRGVDVLYHESTFLEEHQERAARTFHSTAAQAAMIAREAGVGQLVMGHYSNRYQELWRFQAEAEKVFPKCELASDGKIIKI